MDRFRFAFLFWIFVFLKITAYQPLSGINSQQQREQRQIQLLFTEQDMKKMYPSIVEHSRPIEGIVWEDKKNITSVFINPFVYFDMGLLSNLDEKIEIENTQNIQNRISLRRRSKLISMPEDITVFVKLGNVNTIRLGWLLYKSYHSKTAFPVQIEQVGNIDEDDQTYDPLDLTPQTVLYRQLVGEILHQNGMLAMRFLGSGIVQDQDKKSTPYYFKLLDLPKSADPSNQDYGVFSESLVKWNHPLTDGNIQILPVFQRRKLLSVMNQAILKNLWGYHGAWIGDSDFSSSLTNYDNIAFLPEPNPRVYKEGFFDYVQEIRTVSLDKGSLLNNQIRYKDVFLSTFAFHQLRRMGLYDKDILRHFIRVSYNLGKDHFSFYVGKPHIRLFAARILAIDRQTLDVPGNYLSPFNEQNNNKKLRIYDRVVLNTRELLFQLVNRNTFLKSKLTDPELEEIIDVSLFKSIKNRRLLFKEKLIPPELKDHLKKKISLIHEQIIYLSYGKVLKAKSDRIKNRIIRWPRWQNLPTKNQLKDKVVRWLINPAVFVSEFINTVKQSRDTSYSRKLKSHYQTPLVDFWQLPENPVQIFMNSHARGCNNFRRKYWADNVSY